MNIQVEKLDIIQWLAKVNDSKIIKQFMLLKKLNEEITDVKLSHEEREAIDRGLQSINDGRFKSHDEVMEATRKKYAHLFK
jgi:predicted transcriptional regulator